MLFRKDQLTFQFYLMLREFSVKFKIFSKDFEFLKFRAIVLVLGLITLIFVIGDDNFICLAHICQLMGQCCGCDNGNEVPYSLKFLWY